MTIVGRGARGRPRAAGAWSAGVWAGRGYLAVLLLAVLSSGLLLRAGMPAYLSAGLVVLVIAVCIGVLERWVPHRRSWSPTARVFGLDLLHTLVSSQGVAPLVRAGLVIAATSLASVAGRIGLGIWPTEWPIFLQLLIAIPIADFAIYWAHRWMHSTHLGWRLHAIHHSPTRLYFMASARSHPLNVLVTVLCQFGTLLLLGIGEQALSLWAVFMAINGLLQHANIDFQPRMLSRVLATCDVHRAHHALDDSPCNYGNSTMLWDQVFGTYRAPPRHADEVGASGYAIPENYLTHLATPFVLRRFETRQG